MIAWSELNPDGEADVAENVIHLWDVKSQQELFVLKGHSHIVLCLAWSSEGILSGGFDEIVLLWTLHLIESTPTGTSVDIIRKMMGPVICLAWNPMVPLDFVSGSVLSPLCVWRVKKEDRGKVDVRLKWGSVDRFEVTDAKITDAIGLDGHATEVFTTGWRDRYQDLAYHCRGTK